MNQKIKIQIYRLRDTKMHSHIDRQKTNTRQIDTQDNKYISRETNRQTNIQIDKYAEFEERLKIEINLNFRKILMKKKIKIEIKNIKQF